MCQDLSRLAADGKLVWCWFWLCHNVSSNPDCKAMYVSAVPVQIEGNPIVYLCTPLKYTYLPWSRMVPTTLLEVSRLGGHK